MTEQAGCFSGPSRGQLPNVHWRTICMDDLRAHQRFTALPPPEQLDLCSPDAYRFVRQDDRLWSAAHTGVLTSGKLKEALGFLEQGAAKQLGIRTPNPHALLQVYQHLQQPAPHAQPAFPHAAAQAQQHNW